MMPNDTALANFVRDYGDSLLTFMTQHFYKSGLGLMIMTISGIIGFSLLGYAISNKKWSPYFGMYLSAWFILIPISGRPLGYVMYNQLTSRLALEVQEIINGFMKQYKNTPPDFIRNTVFKAASVRITDPKLRDDVHFLIDNCIPRGNSDKGELLTAADLFSGEMDVQLNGAKVFRPRIEPEVLNNLTHRTFKTAGGNTNCKSLLMDTNLSLRNHVESKGILESVKTMVVGPSNGEFEDKRVTTHDPSKDQEHKIGKFAINLAHASAIQAMVLKDYFDTDLDYTGEERQTINPLVEQFKTSHGSSFSPTRIATEVMNVPRMVGRSLNVFDFYENANRLYEINDKLMKMPYYISYLQIILKFIGPLAFMSVFMGTFRFLILWGTTWFLTLCIPWLLILTRLVGNSLMLHQLKIDEMVNKLTSDPNLMNLGIDFSASSNMLKDSSVLMDSILQFEDGLWKAVFLIIPLAGFFGSNAASNLMDKGGKLVSSIVVRKLSSDAVGKVVKVVAPKAALAYEGIKAATGIGKAKTADSNYFNGPKGSS